MVQECKMLAKGERFIVLGLICYCNKTWTDVYQRNYLEPFSFTFCLFNCQCRYKTAAWCTLGYIPDFENMSTATHCISWGGCIGKSQSICNYHKWIWIHYNPIKATTLPFMQIYILETRLPYAMYFFCLHMLWEMV